MNVKLFISSNSGIDFIDHSSNIRVIPDRIVFSEYDKYYENVDIMHDNLYQRMRINKKDISIEIPQYEYIEEAINNALEEGFLAFVFMIDKNDNAYYELVRKIKADYNLNMDIIRTSKKSYPLALTAINILKMYDDGLSFNAIKNYIENGMKSKILLYSHLEENNHNIGITYEDEINNAKPGKLYEYDNGFNLIRQNKNNPFFTMIKMILHEIENKNFKLFILYTYKYSNYVIFLKNKIKEYYPNLDDLLMIPMPVEFSYKLGGNSLGLGYVIDELV